MKQLELFIQYFDNKTKHLEEASFFTCARDNYGLITEFYLTRRNAMLPREYLEETKKWHIKRSS
jgi:hypothetical protein